MTHLTVTLSTILSLLKQYLPFLPNQQYQQQQSRRSKVRETVKLPEEGHRQASRVWEQGKKAKPKATLDRTGSEQPSTIEDMEHERVRKIIYIYLLLQLFTVISKFIENNHCVYSINQFIQIYYILKKI
ncbi:Hypothetical_protein [Hexamita inflata]|uniref:Hypothetical_protein n=1 Tax=Hexamita inflata TaxID=28002 RepID=A0AA86RCG7_9EUKA|nr:Hypothetical protein HINF_LOCUS53919 [Hexamita inflata]CAI9970592.1 Hypothetical protein HINF_LOCUS58237 [Hexamita inflata]